MIKNLAGLVNSDQKFQAKILSICRKSKSVLDAEKRCKAYCNCIEYIQKCSNTTLDTDLSNMRSGLLSAWESIDGEWRKAEVAYRICKYFAKSDVALAREYLQCAEGIKLTITMEGGESSVAYISCVRLAVRSFTGLMRRSLDTSQDLCRLLELIDRLPSVSLRMSLISDIGVGFHIHKQPEKAKRLLLERVRPLVDVISKDDRVKYNETIIMCASALYICHKNSCFDLIDELYVSERDHAYHSIENYIIRRCITSDPYDQIDHHKYSIGYDDALDIIEITKRMTSDYSIYKSVRVLCDGICNKKNQSITGQQRMDILQKLTAIVDAKLPANGFITHDGFKIICHAELLKLSRSSTAECLSLIEKAKQIPNIADRAYVLCVISEGLSERADSMGIKTSALELAYKTIADIPLDSDRISHYQTFCRAIKDVDGDLFKKATEKAMRETISSAEDDIESYQKRFIDMAYQCDPEFASKLASLADNDPARAKSRYESQSAIELLRAKKILSGSSDAFHDVPARDSFALYFPQACWEALGGLNSGRMAKIHIEKTRPYVEMAADLPMERSFPIFSWIIENANKRFCDTDNAKTFLRPMFESFLLTTNLAAQLSQRAFDSVKRSHRDFRESTDNSQIVREHGRGDAIEFIKKWAESASMNSLVICDPYFVPADLD